MNQALGKNSSTFDDDCFINHHRKFSFEPTCDAIKFTTIKNCGIDKSSHRNKGSF